DNGNHRSGTPLVHAKRSVPFLLLSGFRNRTIAHRTYRSPQFLRLFRRTSGTAQQLTVPDWSELFTEATSCAPSQTPALESASEPDHTTRGHAALFHTPRQSQATLRPRLCEPSAR